jgi:hypothetical protein
VKCPGCQAGFTLHVKSSSGHTGQAQEQPAPPAEEAIFRIAGEPAAGAAPVTALPVAAAPPATRKRYRKKEAAAKRQALWIWLAGAGVALVVLLGVGLWLLLRGGGGPGSVGKNVEDVRREPGDSPYRLAAASLPATPGTWKVSPDGVKPADNLRSTFALPGTAVEAILFARPDTARAAVLAASPEQPKTPQPQAGLEWLRYDLRSADPVGRVPLTSLYPSWGLTENDANVAGNVILRPPRVKADLSPSGDVLAVLTAGTPGTIEIRSAAGKRVADVPAPDGQKAIDWLGLIDDTHLLTLAGGRLGLCELPAGRAVYQSAAGFKLPVVLSPGRKWAAAFTDNGFTWLRTATGEVGGTLGLPKTAGPPVGPPEAAFSVDGQHFAAVVPLGPVQPQPGTGSTGNRRLVVVWEVATGKAKDGVIVTNAQMHNFLPNTVQWCGPRQLLLAGTHLLDLDLSMVVWEYKLRPFTRAAGTSPDGRMWYAAKHNVGPQASEIEDLLAQLRDSKLRGEVRKNGLALAAWTLPHAELRKRLAAARRGLAWCLGRAVRIEVGCDDRGFRRTAAEKLADLASGHGFRVDPSAALALRFDLQPPKTQRERGKVIKRIDWQIVQVELLDMTNVVGHLAVVDAGGTECLNLGHFTQKEPARTPSARDRGPGQIPGAPAHPSSLPPFCLAGRRAHRGPVAGPEPDGNRRPPRARAGGKQDATAEGPFGAVRS